MVAVAPVVARGNNVAVSVGVVVLLGSSVLVGVVVSLGVTDGAIVVATAVSGCDVEVAVASLGSITTVVAAVVRTADGWTATTVLLALLVLFAVPTVVGSNGAEFNGSKHAARVSSMITHDPSRRIAFKSIPGSHPLAPARRNGELGLLPGNATLCQS